MTREFPLISLLIVNFHSTDLLHDCLDSVARSTIADRLETIVVDNASPHFDIEALKNRYPDVTWLPQSHNTTYTGGNNIAFGRATAPLVLLLNPDTRLEPGALERAVEHMDHEPSVAAIGAYLLGADGRLQRYYRRLPGLRDLPVLLVEPIFRNTPRGRRFLMLDESFDGATRVENPPGAFLLARRSALKDRLLDDGYFNFVSDLELCDRLNRAGTVMVYDDVRCHHIRAGAGVGTMDTGRRLRLYHDYTWGLRRFFRSRSGWAGKAVLNAALVVYWLSRIAKTARAKPTASGAAFSTAIRAIAGQPPRY